MEEVQEWVNRQTIDSSIFNSDKMDDNFNENIKTFKGTLKIKL